MDQPNNKSQFSITYCNNIFTPLFFFSFLVCKLLQQRVWAVIGPQSMQLTPIIQSITANYHIPFISIDWQPFSVYQGENSSTSASSSRRATSRQMAYESMIGLSRVSSIQNFSINFYPQADQLSLAYLDLIKYKGWKSFALIFDSTEDLIKVKDIYQVTFAETNILIHNMDISGDYMESLPETPSKSLEGAPGIEGDSKEFDIGTRNPNKVLSYQKLMKDMRKKGVENVVLSVPLNKIYKLLKEASRVGLLSVYNDYIIANLDVHTLNLSKFQPLLTNISGYTMLDPSGQQIGHVDKAWIGGRPPPTPKQIMSTDNALISDAISLLTLSMDELINDSKRTYPITEPMVSCKNQQVFWDYGLELMDSMKRTERHGGYTGDLRFNQYGERYDFDLEYVIYKSNGFNKAATWNTHNRLGDMAKHADDFGLQAIRNKTLKVTIARTPPYVMFKQDHEQLEGNAKYEGYCIDLLNLLAAKLGFKFVVKEVADGQYGKIQNGSWTGMIRELLDWEADLAIVDLTITKERQSAVDFTHPFMTLGIAIMFKKPKMEEAELFSFLMPFSTEVWLSMWSAYVGVSMLLWIISRLSPHEWINPHPCFDNPDESDLENELHSVGASLWFTIGSLMQQGSDLAPRSPSVRAMASVWFFFTLILMSSYTANFAAFLTASRMQSPIESAEDLSKQTKINYGCKTDGSTQAFFASSNHSTYRRMWNFMESKKHEGVFPKSNNKGIELVKKGNYAFLMESTTIDYIVQRDCELTQIGGLLDHKGYGIALRKRSPFRAPLSKAIVELNEDGILQDLKAKWWEIENGCVDEKESSLATSELGIDKVGGVFVVLAVGVAVACFAALLEFVWKSLKTSRIERSSLWKLLWEEMLRFFKCGPSKRPAPNTTGTSAGMQSNSQPSIRSMTNSLNQINPSLYGTTPAPPTNFQESHLKHLTHRSSDASYPNRMFNNNSHQYYNNNALDNGGHQFNQDIDPNNIHNR